MRSASSPSRSAARRAASWSARSCAHGSTTSPTRNCRVHYAKAIADLDEDDLHLLAAWHASLEVGQPIPNTEFLVGVFPSLGENRREALKIAAGFRGEEAFQAGVAEEQALDTVLPRLSNERADRAGQRVHSAVHVGPPRLRQLAGPMAAPAASSPARVRSTPRRCVLASLALRSARRCVLQPPRWSLFRRRCLRRPACVGPWKRPPVISERPLADRGCLLKHCTPQTRRTRGAAADAETADATATEEDVMDALSNVIDPELGLDFVELGLIYGVEIAGGETSR